ncbi:zinc-ribbon domain-containing protein [Priestia sp. SB1]|uniref:zinc-ribbon domain-containing protein n=1 Tax=Priestia sp. SB1 TaxID=3132359 RepID=UPI00316D69E7
MKIENLSEGQVFKNYRVLCRTLEMPIKEGNSRKAQLKILDLYCKWSRSGNSIKIEQIYEKPLTKVENRGRSGGIHGNGCKYESLDITNPDLLKEWDYSKNNINPKDITLSSSEVVWWKCGSCNYEWDTRVRIRARNKRGCPMCNGSKGEKRIYQFFKANEIPFTHQYKIEGLTGVNGSQLRFDCAVLNEDKSLKLLIEFDGQYHFQPIDGDIEAYKRITEHDKRKNEYCKKHGIKLMRFHYKYYEVLDQLLALEFGIDGYEEQLIKKPKSSIIDYYEYKIDKIGRDANEN